MSWHKLTLKVIDVLALLGHRCLGTHQLGFRARREMVKKRSIHVVCEHIEPFRNDAMGGLDCF